MKFSSLKDSIRVRTVFFASVDHKLERTKLDGRSHLHYIVLAAVPHYNEY
jgi:hypothetical protein